MRAYRLGTCGLSRCALLSLAIAFVAPGCGSSHSASTTAGPTFPETPAGVQARWFFQALTRLPISGAALRAHAAPVVLAHITPAEINSSLAGFGQLRLLSVTSKQPNSVAFVISVRGAQRVRFKLNVDARGLIAGFSPQALVPTASPASVIPTLASGWVAGPVTFTAGGVTIYGTYTRPRAATAGTLPGALLLGGSGSTTDRNDNNPNQLHRNALEAVANWLSADGVASLRYDKLGSGQTGWGPYAKHPERVGIKPYEQEAVAALSFLAGQRHINRARLAVFGHSEGGIYALLLATGLAGNAPKVHAVGLLEPVNLRFLSGFNWSAAAASATASLRRTGALPSGLPAAVSSVFKANGTAARAVADRRLRPRRPRGQTHPADSRAPHLQQRRRQIHLRSRRSARSQPHASEAQLCAPRRRRPLPQGRHHPQRRGIQPSAAVLDPAAIRASNVHRQQPVNAEAGRGTEARLPAR